jgi:hypothetical protein
VAAAIESREAFDSGLRAIGLPESEVARIVSLRDETDTQLRAVNAEIRRYRPPDEHYAFDPVPPNLYVRRDSLWRRLADSLAGREIRVLEATDADVRVPLFVLSCPDVDGCAAAFDREEMRGHALAWSLTVYGSGVGGSRDVSASASAGFTAAAGETKLVFIPLTVTVQRVAVLEAGRQIGTGVQVDGSSVRTDSNPGLLLLPPGTTPPEGAPVQRFPLAGDTTGALATYQWKYTRTSKRNAEVGLEAFGMKASLKVGSELSTQVVLKYELRGGYDYVLLNVAQGDGLLWAPHGSGRQLVQPIA